MDCGGSVLVFQCLGDRRPEGTLNYTHSLFVSGIVQCCMCTFKSGFVFVFIFSGVCRRVGGANPIEGKKNYGPIPAHLSVVIVFCYVF